ncbi:MAG: hypothetical protein ACLQGP_08965 [Isosphaeraceae bacterium]
MEDYRLGGMIIVRIGCRVFSNCEGREAGWIVGLERDRSAMARGASTVRENAGFAESNGPLLGSGRAVEDTHER